MAAAAPIFRGQSQPNYMHDLLWWAVVLVVLWIIARVFLAITSFLLHLLLVIAAIMGLIWLVNRLGA